MDKKKRERRLIVWWIFSIALSLAIGILILVSGYATLAVYLVRYVLGGIMLIACVAGILFIILYAIITWNE